MGMIRKPIKKRWRIILGILSIILMVGTYTFISHRQHETNPDDTTIPTWKQLKGGVKTALEVNRRSGERWIVVDSIATLKRLLLGLFFGIAGALVFGLLMGCLGVMESFFIPPLTILALIPPTAALAVYFVLVGTDTEMYVTMIALGIGATMARVIYLAVKDVPHDLLYKAYTLGASECEVVWNVIFRYILPKFLDTIRLHIPPAMIFLIAAEMVCGDVGFGYRIRLQSRLLNMSVVYPYLAMLAAYGFTMDFGLRKLQRLICPWYVPEGRQ